MSDARRATGVLVVDDDASIRTMLDLALRHHGFAVVTAPSGQEATRLFKLRRQLIDVALLDVRMEGMDGPATLHALREIDADLPCCFMSGDSGPYDKNELLALGAAYVFPKPFHLTEVMQALSQAAKSRANTPQSDSSSSAV